MTTYGLPLVLEEIAAIAGLDAAREIARQHGGTRRFVPLPARLSDDHWLVKAVGIEQARLIADHYGTRCGTWLPIPAGPWNSYRDLQRRREAAMREALAGGATLDQAARAAGVDRSSVIRFKQRMRLDRQRDQGSLFD